MYTREIANAFEAVVVLSTLGGAAASAWIFRDPAKATSRHTRASWLFHPLAQLLLVCTLIFTNQILCHAYVLRVHHGDASFITRHLGWGWFAPATHGVLAEMIRFVASHVGDGRWLAPTVLRVQAFLELPFTLFAYLAVTRLLGRELHLRLVRPPLLALASASFSITFSLVELALPNPYTHDDLALRALSAIVAPVWVALASRAEGPCERESRPSGALGLLAFLAGAGAIAYVVLACYDALLLYNRGHLPTYAGGLVVASAIAAAASWTAPRLDRMLARPRSRAMECVASALAAFTTLFFVPSLALRYWGGHASAVLAGCTLVGLSGLIAVASSRRVHLAIGAVLSAVVGAIAAAHAFATPTATSGSGFVIPELVLARGAVAFLAVGIVAFRLFEVCWPAHEAKAEADQA